MEKNVNINFINVLRNSQKHIAQMLVKITQITEEKKKKERKISHDEQFSYNVKVNKNI